jgi:hypothetical protein
MPGSGAVRSTYAAELTSNDYFALAPRIPFLAPCIPLGCH